MMEPIRNRNDGGTQESMVVWRYVEHPTRLVIAVFALLTAVQTAGLLFFQSPSNNNEISAASGLGFLTGLSVVGFSILVVVVCLRKRIDGHFIRSNEVFEIDTGRGAPNFLAAVSVFFEFVMQPSFWLKTDLSILGRQCWRWFIPLRRYFKGNIIDVERIALESGLVGANVVIYIGGKELTVAEDVSIQEAKRLCSEIERAIV